LELIDGGKTDLAYLPPLLFSILPHMRIFVACRVVAAYLPEATDVVLNVAWDSEIWCRLCELFIFRGQYCRGRDISITVVWWRFPYQRAGGTVSQSVSQSVTAFVAWIL
jgi:hypothetical protein